MPDRDLSFLPAAHEWVGLFGVLVPVPAEWNLRVYRGDYRRGMLGFADLRAVRLEVRWRPGRQTVAHLAHRLQQTEPGAVLCELPLAAWQVNRRAATDILAADPGRIYELHFPAPCDEGAITSCAEAFIRAQRLLSAREDRLWSVYGACGWVPARARAKAITLLPGRTELRLAYRGGRASLGSLSLADRLLADGTLRAWAQAWERTAALSGRWEQPDADSVQFHGAIRRWGRRQSHRIVLHHDRRGNRLVWDHRVGRA